MTQLTIKSGKSEKTGLLSGTLHEFAVFSPLQKRYMTAYTVEKKHSNHNNIYYASYI